MCAVQMVAITCGRQLDYFVITTAGHPEESGLSSLAATYSRWTLPWPEHLPLYVLGEKEDATNRSPHQILWQRVFFLTEGTWKATVNTEIISYVLPESWQKRWPKLEALSRHSSFWLYEDMGFIQSFTSVLSHWPTPDQIPAQWKTYRIPGGARQDALEHLRWHSMTVGIEIYVFALTLTLRTEKNPHPVRQHCDRHHMGGGSFSVCI